MLKQQKHFETENQAHLAVKIEEAKKAYIKEMENVKAENLQQKDDITRLTDEVKELNDRLEEVAREYSEVD